MRAYTFSSCGPTELFEKTANETVILSFWDSEQPQSTKYHRCPISLHGQVANHLPFFLCICVVCHLVVPSACAVELPGWQQDHHVQWWDGQVSTQSLPLACSLSSVLSTLCRSNLLGLHSPTSPSYRPYFRHWHCALVCSETSGEWLSQLYKE